MKKLKSILDDPELIKKMENIDINKMMEEDRKEREEKCKAWENAEKKRFDNIECPVCKSKDKSKVAKHNSNGIIGPGHSSWVTEEYLVCSNCGVMFKDLNKPKNGNPYTKRSRKR